MLKRIGVLASGGGSNLAALHAYLAGMKLRGGESADAPEIVLVASDQERAGALERARAWGMPTAVLRERGGDTGQLHELLRAHEVELIVLAGYLRLVPRSVVREYSGRTINVHPALLPAFGGAGMYGERVHKAVLEAGARVTGVTVHFVDDEYDRGAIIAQWPVPVLPEDSVKTLAARVLRVEHILLPRAVCAVARGSIRLGAGRPIRAPVVDNPIDEAFILRAENDEQIAEGIAAMLSDD
jgi:phosphoribosylglycinamide formyltransferase 1